VRLHPRERLVDLAENELTRAILDVREKHDITGVEYLQFLTLEMQRTLKYMLRYERHGDGEKEAGLAYDEDE